jgi:hypothetical protein
VYCIFGADIVFISSCCVKLGSVNEAIPGWLGSEDNSESSVLNWDEVSDNLYG